MVFQSVYSPTLYLINGHLQTFFYAIIEKITKKEDFYPHDRTLVPLPDGGQISVDCTVCKEVDEHFNETTPIVVILPGLTGNRYDLYIKALISEVVQRRYKCVILNHRGCSGTPLTSRKLIN